MFWLLGALNLPCLLCLAKQDDLPDDRWREVCLSAECLDGGLKAKLRQHLDRAHRLSARDPDCKAMIAKSKQMLCPILHKRERQEVWKVGRSPVIDCSFVDNSFTLLWLSLTRFGLCSAQSSFDLSYSAIYFYVAFDVAQSRPFLPLL